MKEIAPDYLGDFACLMENCLHSCCIGWEIDVDEATFERYRAVPGALGRRLADSISTDGDAPCFRLTADKRCPFLNASGLCELILALGEDSLCQICADHPRFRNFFSGRTEIGLGLCCESAGRLILLRSAPMRLVALLDDGRDDSPTDEEAALLELRDALIALAQDRTAPVERRIDRLLARVGAEMSGQTCRRWAEFLLTLERLDDAWTEWLTEWIHAPDLPMDSLSSPEWEVAFEQLLVYLLYRHLPGALEDGDVVGRVRFAAMGTRLLRQLCAAREASAGQVALEDLVEFARLFSSEIEYSDENLGTVLDFLD